MQDLYDVVIIGGGPAGLTAGIYTSRANLKTLIIAGNPAGGQLMWTSEVENFPGFPEGIMGPELIENMRKQAEKYGCELVNENVQSINGTFESSFLFNTDEKKEYKGKTIIIATGANAKWLGLESEQRLRGRGVSACAVCDGFFFKERMVAVVGGGDAAMEEANYLTKFASKVYLIIRGDKENLKASKFMQSKVFENNKIEILYKSQVKEVIGENFVEGLLLDCSGKDQKLDVQGLFVAIGHKPSTEFLNGFVDLDEKGYVKVTSNTLSNIKGVFVAGDVSDYKYRQAISAAGLGCMAALDAEKFLVAHAE